eukprot:g68000.t1
MEICLTGAPFLCCAVHPREKSENKHDVKKDLITMTWAPKVSTGGIYIPDQVINNDAFAGSVLGPSMKDKDGNILPYASHGSTGTPVDSQECYERMRQGFA